MTSITSWRAFESTSLGRADHGCPNLYQPGFTDSVALVPTNSLPACFVTERVMLYLWSYTFIVLLAATTAGLSVLDEGKVFSGLTVAAEAANVAAVASATSAISVVFRFVMVIPSHLSFGGLVLLRGCESRIARFPLCDSDADRTLTPSLQIGKEDHVSPP